MNRIEFELVPTGCHVRMLTREGVCVCELTVTRDSRPPETSDQHWYHKAFEMIEDRDEIIRKWNSCPLLKAKAEIGLV